MSIYPEFVRKSDQIEPANPAAKRVLDGAIKDMVVTFGLSFREFLRMWTPEDWQRWLETPLAERAAYVRQLAERHYAKTGLSVPDAAIDELAAAYMRAAQAW